MKLFSKTIDLMKKIILFGSERNSLELGALFLFALIVVSNLAVIKFAEGYFEYFDISLGSINFTPQLYDYVRIAMPVLIISTIITLVVAFVMNMNSFIGKFFANRTKPSKKLHEYAKRHENFFENLSKLVDFIFIAFIAGTVVWLFYSSTTDLAKSFGEVSAKNTTKLSSISQPSDNTQEIIIYKGNDEIITKNYDTSKKVFFDGYQVLVSSNYEVRYINN